jgi:peptidyl-Lys metalloendopeptidase
MKPIWKVVATLIVSVLASAHVSFAAPAVRDREDNSAMANARFAYTEMRSNKAYHPAGQEVTVQVSFRNTSAAPIAIAKWVLDADDPDRSFLSVTRDGQAAPYIGALVKRAAPTADDVVMLAPGQSIEMQYEISSVFDISEGGVYDVGVNSTNKHVLGTRLMGSDTISIAVEPDANRRIHIELDHQKAAGAGGVSYTGRCTSSQKSSLTSALSSASTYASGAASYLSGTPSATQRYTTWFGTLSTSNWNTVKSHFAKILSAIDTQPITFDCGCKKKDTYAYVYANQPYKIYLCGAFWNASLTGTDSKAGTIVHEMSHFTVNGGTSDYAYGQSAAKSLAISDPAQAIQNADSHEYFAENTPSLP